jgi:hypothetical protein
MKAADFEIVKEARRAAHAQLAFFREMLDAKRAAEAVPAQMRLVCASTCADWKLHGKPCKCYPGTKAGVA